MNFFKKLTQITVIILTLCIGYSFAELIAEYHFEDNGTDVSGNGHDADFMGVSFVDGLVGNALDYNIGACATWTSGYYFWAPDAGDELDLYHMTLEVWVFPTSFGCPMNVINKWGPYNFPSEERCYNLNITPGGYPSFFLSPDGFHHGDKEVRGTELLPLDAWSHLVATYDGSKMRLYVDGLLVKEKDETCIPYNSSGPLSIGIDGFGNYPLGGLIDNARVYNEALSAEVVAAHYAEFGNQAPVANAGGDQTAHPGAVITLNGSGSNDPDGNYPLTYAWALTGKPTGSLAVLSNPADVSTTFEIDKLGDYVVELVVTDAKGAESSPDPVTVSTFNSAPVADAGEDQAITLIGTTVDLNGTESYDDDGDPISYLWEITGSPVNSEAVLVDAETTTPSLTPDEYGAYTISLTVSDPWVSSTPDEVVVSFENVAPVAVTDGNKSCMVNESVSFTGVGSSDANGDELSYNWQIVAKPEGSLAEIVDPSSMVAYIQPDAAGEYVISLTVNDGTIDSEPATVTIAVISVEDVTTQTLQEASEAIDILPASALKNKKMAKTTTNMINSVLLKIDDDDIEGAYNQLKNAILKKTDGCAESGAPDKNDWIKDCESQELVYPVLIEALDLLFELLE